MSRRRFLLLACAAVACAIPAGCLRRWPGPPRPWPVRVVCPYCGGEGSVSDDGRHWATCPRCGGKGWYWR